jgi:hypothetical protein
MLLQLVFVAAELFGAYSVLLLKRERNRLLTSTIPSGTYRASFRPRRITSGLPVIRPQSGRNGASNSLFSTRLSAQSVAGDELDPRTGTTQEPDWRSGVGGVQLSRAKHCDHLGRNSKSKDRYGLELLAMRVVA